MTSQTASQKQPPDHSAVVLRLTEHEEHMAKINRVLFGNGEPRKGMATQFILLSDRLPIIEANISDIKTGFEDFKKTIYRFLAGIASALVIWFIISQLEEQQTQAVVSTVEAIIQVVTATPSP